MKRTMGFALGILVLTGFVSIGAASDDMAMSFGGNDRVTIPNAASLSPSAITIELDVNFGRLASGTGWSDTDSQMMLCKGDDRTNGSYRIIQGGPAGPGTLAFCVNNWYDTGVTGVTTDLVTNQWYHIAATYDGSDMRLYLDGVLKSSKHFVGTLGANSKPLSLGYMAMTDWTYFLTGKLDDVRIWNYARSATEIQGDMNTYPQGNESGLVAFWNFDEANGCQTAYDLTANHNDGMLGSTLGVDGDDPARVPVPEPATVSLIVLGAMAIIRRR